VRRLTKSPACTLPSALSNIVSPPRKITLTNADHSPSVSTENVCLHRCVTLSYPIII
jgi:hypothetical protein